MHITDKQVEGLIHTYRGELALADLRAKEDEWLSQHSANVKVDGFRAGKVPLPIMRQRYGEKAHQQAVQDLLSKTCDGLIKDSQIKISGQPQITKFEEKDDIIDIEVRLEALPPMPEVNVTGIKIERPQIDVDGKNLDEQINQFLKAVAPFKPVEKAQAFKGGDQLIIDFDGEISGIEKKYTQANDFALTLGLGEVYPDFEKALMKHKVGDVVDVKFTFDAALEDKQLAGKTAQFKVTIKEHKEPEAVNLDDELAKKYGFENVEALRKHFYDTIAQVNKNYSFLYEKRQVLDALANKYQFDCPPTLVENELDVIVHELTHEKENDGHVHGPDCNHEVSDDEKEQYRDIAMRRVRLGLLIAHLGSENKITVTREELAAQVTAEARRYPGQEKKVVEYYQNNPEALVQLRAPIFEDKVVAFITSQAKVSEKKMTREDVINKLETLDNENKVS